MNNQQYPQQPGWGGPQQPYGQPPFQPQPPKKRGVGKFIGLGCLGIVGLFVLIAVIAAVAGGGSKSKSSGSGHTTTVSSPSKGQKAATQPKRKVVTFKVWGTAPAGALGGLDITYGSDSDTRKGTFKNGEFEATLPFHKDALFYTVSAQLQGSGDINCSVTVDGHTKKGHASGGYNICDAQLNAGLLGDWD
ncbi:hypothetical protein ABZT17_33250 [Streptomyces sp. NPDC005648]|uniref:hypothetical protein n=1 Tax=Streptomyces sp. NPDC005648 TaxID=3157044 RepID=UPI0033B90AEC